MAGTRRHLRKDKAAHHLPIWQEALVGVEILLLHAAPVYYGFGVPRGDDSGVVIIPGFLSPDLYLLEMYAWLARIGQESVAGVDAIAIRTLGRKNQGFDVEIGAYGI